MRKPILELSLLCLALSPLAYSQESGQILTSPGSPLMSHAGAGRAITPLSGIERPEDLGLSAHTHFKIFVPPGRPDATRGFEEDVDLANNTPVTGYYAETPASLACLYGLVSSTSGCNPSSLANTKVATGGSKAIAIVDAYDYPTAMNDLTKYSAQFGLPAPTSSTFTVTWPSAKPGTDPSCSPGNGWDCWETEEALDIEMAHAAAPKAHIYLVEAASSNFSDLFAAEKKAIALVAAAGGGEVSNSWGGGEFSGETSYDSDFLGTKVVVFASSGDSEGTEYPSASPNVVGVGGTTITRSPATLDFEHEISWEDGGGGISPYEKIPSYQSGISKIVGTHRGIPDIAAVGNPRTGVWVYNSFDNKDSGTLEPWNIIGGTSVASPLSAALVNHAGHFYASSSAELSEIYANAKTSTDFRDVTYGTCGYYEGWFAGTGWDPCTGNGASLGGGGK